MELKISDDFFLPLPTDHFPTGKTEILSEEVMRAFSLAHKPWIPHPD